MDIHDVVRMLVENVGPSVVQAMAEVKGSWGSGAVGQARRA